MIKEMEKMRYGQDRFPNTIANSASKSDLSFHDEIKSALNESVNVKRTIMEVEKRGKVHVLKADFMATSMGTRPGDTAICSALGMGDMNCKVLRLAEIFSDKVISYRDSNQSFEGLGNGGGTSWDEVLEMIK